MLIDSTIYIDLLPRAFVGNRRGEAVLSVLVLDDGTIARIAVRESSGYPDIDQRIEQMTAEGVAFRTGIEIGATLPIESLLRDFDAVVLSGGAEWPRDLEVPGRGLDGGVELLNALIDDRDRPRVERAVAPVDVVGILVVDQQQFWTQLAQGTQGELGQHAIDLGVLFGRKWAAGVGNVQD